MHGATRVMRQVSRPEHCPRAVGNGAQQDVAEQRGANCAVGSTLTRQYPGNEKENTMNKQDAMIRMSNAARQKANSYDDKMVDSMFRQMSAAHMREYAKTLRDQAMEMLVAADYAHQAAMLGK
jgi:hypothetical protein